MNILIIVVIVILIRVAWTWNRLTSLRAAMHAAWASVDALLKRRADLIPNLVAVVKGAMDFESDTLQRVVEARGAALGANGRSDRATAEQQLTGTVSQLFAMVERYPELKANAQILALQHELAETESDIASARRYYNAVVRDLNIMRETFPNLLVAGPMGFVAGEYFQLDDGDRAVPQANLNRS
ncbi:MAG: LemA family protein [Gemmatimonadales bacterium]